MSAYKIVTANQLNETEKSGGIIVDVRTPAEHTERQLKRKHEHIPLDQLNPKDFMMRRGLDKDAPVYLLCKGGTRARVAADKFVSEGYANVNVIEGGIIACEISGEPVKTGAAPNTAASAAGTFTFKVPSLERQVRIAAGILVLLGSWLALSTSAFFAIIPLAVGAGLIYAGVTDNCGMAMALMKAPWNKTAPVAQACATNACSTANPAADSAPKSGGCA